MAHNDIPTMTYICIFSYILNYYVIYRICFNWLIGSCNRFRKKEHFFFTNGFFFGIVLCMVYYTVKWRRFYALFLAKFSFLKIDTEENEGFSSSWAPLFQSSILKIKKQNNLFNFQYFEKRRTLCVKNLCMNYDFLYDVPNVWVTFHI